MREIKFRGKRLNNYAWVYGGIYNTFHPNCDSDCYAICADGKDYFVEQSTIGQFTGLYDKNGKEIYEGDIVSLNKDLLGSYVIKYDTKNARFSMYCGDFEQAGFNLETMKNYEVIGNIHDNLNL